MCTLRVFWFLCGRISWGSVPSPQGQPTRNLAAPTLTEPLHIRMGGATPGRLGMPDIGMIAILPGLSATSGFSGCLRPAAGRSWGRRWVSARCWTLHSRYRLRAASFVWLAARPDEGERCSLSSHLDAHHEQRQLHRVPRQPRPNGCDAKVRNLDQCRLEPPPTHTTPKNPSADPSRSPSGSIRDGTGRLPPGSACGGRP